MQAGNTTADLETEKLKYMAMMRLESQERVRLVKRSLHCSLGTLILMGATFFTVLGSALAGQPLFCW